jgi:hypothetical protein
MIVNVHNRREVESFLRFANLNELVAEQERLNRLLVSHSQEESETQLKALAGRINYEMRFCKAA